MASTQVDELVFGLGDLGELRRLVVSAAVEAGLSDRRASDLALACNEIATNAIVHGRPPATARIWGEDGKVVCEVTDAGGGIKDPHPGRDAPLPGAPGGRGMWLARQLTDELEIREGGGCRVLVRAAANA
jgi:serine/threonine-protein kinase RsbW